MHYLGRVACNSYLAYYKYITNLSKSSNTKWGCPQFSPSVLSNEEKLHKSLSVFVCFFFFFKSGIRNFIWRLLCSTPSCCSLLHFYSCSRDEYRDEYRVASCVHLQMALLA